LNKSDVGNQLLSSPGGTGSEFEVLNEYPLGETVRVEILAPEIFKKLR
jgi:hypothetical protein